MLVDLDKVDSDVIVKKDGKWYEVYEWGASEVKQSEVVVTPVGNTEIDISIKECKLEGEEQ